MGGNNWMGNCILIVIFLVLNVNTREVEAQGEIINLNAFRSAKVWTAISANYTTKDFYEVPAQVPGGIYSDLEAAGIFPTPIYYRYNDLETRWVGRTNWTFYRQFEAKKSFTSKSKQEIVFEGLDSVASIFINDQFIGESNNMFVRYIFNVKNIVKPGKNHLRVEFQSPVEYARKKWEEQTKSFPVPPAGLPKELRGEDHANHIRKMQASFAWDWGPSYPSSGIWKDTYLQGYDDAVIRDVLVSLKSNNSLPSETSGTLWNVTVKLFLENSHNIQPNVTISVSIHIKHNVTVSVTKNMNQSSKWQDIILQLQGGSVKLWWPNGYGKQPLYQLAATLNSPNGDKIASKTLQIGFRNIELIENPILPGKPELGNEFYFRVNGIPVYSKGSNLVPIHVLPERATPEKTRWIIESAKKAHMNMIRVWGGGVYQSDLFYQLADQAGILVWQDFMFACSMYPTNPEFLETVKMEVETQVKRIQYHASLALWATNSENEIAIRSDWYNTSRNKSAFTADYIRLYVDTVKSIVKVLDGSRPCLGSSPSNGKYSELEGWIAENPNDWKHGDVHTYLEKGDFWNYRIYPVTRFTSEYGSQAWPSAETLRIVFKTLVSNFLAHIWHLVIFQSTSIDDDWSWESEMMSHRQRHHDGQNEIINSIKQNLPLPKWYDEKEYFQTVLELNRISQAMAVKTETELYRRSKEKFDVETGLGRNMGALFWQLNDIWPGASWASIEWNGKWKLLQYYARNFFAPLIVSPYEITSARFKEDQMIIAIDVVSDLPTDFTSNLTVKIFELTSLTSIHEMNLPINLTSLEAVEVIRLNSTEWSSCSSPKDNICILTTSMVGAPDNFLFLQYPNNASLIPDPNIRITYWTSADRPYTFNFTLAVDTVAIFVTLNIKDIHIKGTFSDNGFIMSSPFKTVTFEAETSLALQDFQDNLEFWSLYDLVLPVQSAQRK